MQPPPPATFFESPSLRLSEANGCIRFVTPAQGWILALAPWRFLGVDARDSELLVFGAFADLGENPAWRVASNLAPEDALAAAHALIARLGLPKPLEVCDAREVERDPHAYDGRHVEITALWSDGFERSSFAGAWLSGRCLTALPDGDRLVRARGIWRAAKGEGYGHLGASAAELVAYQIEPA